MEKEERRSLIDVFKGDKAIWMIYVVLAVFSLVVVFSSTSLNTAVLSGTVSRFALFKDQLLALGLGFAALLLFCALPKGFIKDFGGPASLILSLIVAVMLLFKIKAVPTLEGRAFRIAGMQIFGIDILKVTMVLYLAWAMDRYKKEGFKILLPLKERYPKLFKWSEGAVERAIIFYLPVAFCVGCVILKGTSSALILAMVCFITLSLGLKKKHKRKLFALAISTLAIAFAVIVFTPKEKLPGRLETVKQRISWKIHTPGADEYYAKAKSRVEKERAESKQILKYLIQIEGCKMAVHNGGFTGVGVGSSRQKYIVPNIYGDYAFAFICEEYGIILGIILIFVYLTIAARGMQLVRNIKDPFEKYVLAGLCLMISLQAIMHIMVNADCGPTTGQTLPLLSHGKCAFICVSAAFGLILNYSNSARKSLDKEREQLLVNSQGQQE